MTGNLPDCPGAKRNVSETSSWKVPDHCLPFVQDPGGEAAQRLRRGQVGRGEPPRGQVLGLTARGGLGEKRGLDVGYGPCRRSS